MSLLDKAGTLASFARLAISVARHDTGRLSPVLENPKFMSAHQAAALIGDGAVVAASGLGAHQRASLLYWALRDRFVAEGHPRRLTLVNVGGHGGRGLLPGTLDELAQPGLCARLISSHFETCHGFLARSPSTPGAPCAPASRCSTSPRSASSASPAAACCSPPSCPASTRAPTSSSACRRASSCPPAAPRSCRRRWSPAAASHCRGLEGGRLVPRQTRDQRAALVQMAEELAAFEARCLRSRSP